MPESTTGLRAGAGRTVIDYPETLWPLEDFNCVHDPLAVRVLVLEPDASGRIVLAVLDQTSLPPEPLALVREVLSRATGADPDQILVVVSHTFSAPHLLAMDETPAPLREKMSSARAAVLAAVEGAADQAVEALQPANVGHGVGTCGINVNRDVETAAGWWLGASESGYSDKTVHIVRIDGVDRNPIAVLVNYAVQPSAMNESRGADGRRAVTADIAGAAVASVESALGADAVAFFLIGAAGDQSPAVTAVRWREQTDGSLRTHDAGPRTHVAVQLLGERLATEALRVTSSISTTRASAGPVTKHAITVLGQVALPRERIHPVRVSPAVPDEDRTLPFWLLRIGSITLVGVQVELSATIGRQIMDRSPVPAFVATMVNGGAKYLPEASAFERITYEAMSSRYAGGAAEQLSEAITAALSDPDWQMRARIPQVLIHDHPVAARSRT